MQLSLQAAFFTPLEFVVSINFTTAESLQGIFDSFCSCTEQCAVKQCAVTALQLVPELI